MLCFHLGSVGGTMLLSTELRKVSAQITCNCVKSSSTRARGCVVARTGPRTKHAHSPILIPSQINISRTNKTVFSVACLQISELLRLETTQVWLRRIFHKDLMTSAWQKIALTSFSVLTCFLDKQKAEK